MKLLSRITFSIKNMKNYWEILNKLTFDEGIDPPDPKK